MSDKQQQRPESGCDSTDNFPRNCYSKSILSWHDVNLAVFFFFWMIQVILSSTVYAQLFTFSNLLSRLSPCLSAKEKNGRQFQHITLVIAVWADRSRAIFHVNERACCCYRHIHLMFVLLRSNNSVNKRRGRGRGFLSWTHMWPQTVWLDCLEGQS